MKDFLLSICIPTFDRGEIVNRTVQNILKYMGDDIEVVVSDNCSTDNTAKLLNQIKDVRFKYYKNDYNNGGDNLISVLTYASGDYRMLLSDEDDVDIKMIPKIIGIIKETTPGLMLTGVSVNKKRYVYNGYSNTEKGFAALKKYGFGCTYMSGYIYDGSILDRIFDGFTGTSVNKRYGYMYNFTNLARRTLQYGNYVTIEEMFIKHREDGKRDINTHTSNGKMVYSPECKIDCLFEAVRELKNMQLSDVEKMYLIRSYMHRIILRRHISDYNDSFNRNLIKEIELEGATFICKYYLDNRNEIIGIKWIIRYLRNLKVCIRKIDELKIFDESYVKLIFKYNGELKEIDKMNMNRLKKFWISKKINEL